MKTTHFRTCNLCEAMCGLEISLENNEITKIEGDKNDQFSRGHICPKAYGLKEIYEDKNRLKFPQLKKGGKWVTISWEEGYQIAAEKIKEVQSKYGNDAVAVYQGNPSIHNLGTMMFGPDFFKLLKTKNMFTATSTDQLPHHFASWLMFGHPLLIPIPDIDRTDFMLIMGGNPLVSNGSMMSVPDVGKRLREIQERGGKFVVIDPRKTETAEKADQHIFIRPNTDAYLLMAMIKLILDQGKENINHVESYMEGLEKVREFVTGYDIKTVSEITGIEENIISDLTNAFLGAKTAVCYGRIGLSTQSFGGVSQWLINVLNIITGNIDTEGGAMFTLAALDFISNSKPKNRFDRWQSRVRKLPEFLGELPVACLAEEISEPGEGQIKMLITSCGNPVLSIPNGTKLEKALPELDFMISFDIYLNETTLHADLILPPASGLECSHYDLTFHNLAVRNTAKYSPPLFDKTEGAKYDWEIFQELKNVFLGEENQLLKPEDKLTFGLMYGSYGITFQDLVDNPHGIDLGALKSQFPKRLKQEKINLAPDLLLSDKQRLAESKERLIASKNDFLLIGRRGLRDNNSWMHNLEKLMKGKDRCTLLIHPADAEKLRLIAGQNATVASRVGKVTIPFETTDEMMRGVVSIPHGYGHTREGTNMQVAEKNGGVSVNDLTDHLELDTLTGNAAFSNVKVRIGAG